MKPLSRGTPALQQLLGMQAARRTRRTQLKRRYCLWRAAVLLKGSKKSSYCIALSKMFIYMLRVCAVDLKTRRRQRAKWNRNPTGQRGVAVQLWVAGTICNRMQLAQTKEDGLCCFA